MSRNYDKLIAEVFEKDKVLVHCERHMYVGDPKIAPHGAGRTCPDCWKAFFVTMFAMASPETRAEQIEDLNAVGHMWAEKLDRGQIPQIPNTYSTIDKKEMN